MKTALQRIMYSNYHLCDYYDEAEKFLKDEFPDKYSNEIPENDVWDEIHTIDEINWDDIEYELKHFFDGDTYIAVGSVGRWDGTYDAGILFENFFNDFFNKVMKHCDYVKMWDENGHFYFKCSHHDGTNMFEIKRLTEQGIDYYNRWCESDDNRSEQYIHRQIFNKYSCLPHFMHKMYGMPKTQYKKEDNLR